MTNIQLMAQIKVQWSSLIEEIVAQSPIQSAFLAALIAGESGGNPTATRFEPAVYTRLKDKFPQWTDQRVRDNATSWGLTQIMGENYPGPPVELAYPKINLIYAVEMLVGFAKQYRINLDSELGDLFRCWNTGQPQGKTYDPNYVSNGLSRMSLWE